jgi:hypothetical protein
MSKEKSHKVVIFHVCKGALLSNRLQWKFAIGLGYYLIGYAYAIFGGCMLRVLVFAMDQIEAFPIRS